MGVDEPGKQPGVAEVDDLEAGRLQLCRRADFDDTVAFDEHRDAIACKVRAPVDEMGRFDQDALGGRRSYRLCDEQECEEHTRRLARRKCERNPQFSPGWKPDSTWPVC